MMEEKLQRELVEERPKKHRLNVLVVIADRKKRHKIAELFQANNLKLHFTLFGKGTASSEITDLLGIGSTDKVLNCCIASKSRIPSLIALLTDELKLKKPNKGVVFSLPLSGSSTTVLRILNDELYQQLEPILDDEVRNVSKNATHDLILALINQGCSEDLMTVARQVGATGGTVIKARRIGSDDTIKAFGIEIQPEREIVAILTERSKKKEIMHALGQSCGIRSEASGIFVSLPVDSVAGLPERIVRPDPTEE
jgi:hypothetical protein